MDWFLNRRVIAMSLLLSVSAGSAGADVGVLYVSTEGNDAWSGAFSAPQVQGNDGPFRSLERARDEIRKRKNDGTLPVGEMVVELQPGVYERTKAFELTAEDSGTAECRIVYRGSRSGQVRLVGGKVIGDWLLVTDPAVLSRMDEGARGKVWQADVGAQGLTDLGEMSAGKRWGASSPGLEVFFQRRAHDPRALAQRGIRDHPPSLWRPAAEHPRHEGLHGRDIRLQRGSPRALAQREGHHAARVLVLGLGGPTPQGADHRHYPEADHA